MNSHENDIEARLRSALGNRAVREVPDHRPTPPAPWLGGDLVRPKPDRRSWLIPLAAAACAVGIVTAIVVSLSHRDQPVPGSPPTTGTGLSSAGTGLPTPSRTTSAQTPLSGTVTLAGAKVVLPDGWTADRAPDLLGGQDTWCLGPDGSCRVWFHRFDPARPSPDVELPMGSDGSTVGVCEPAVEGILTAARTATLGGREAEFRSWSFPCPSVTVAQYVVPTAPAYELVTKSDVPGVLDDLASLARTITLPPGDGGVRLSDQGTVTSATPAGDGFDITLKRAVGGNVNDWTYPSSTTYPYHVPASVLPAGMDLATLSRLGGVSITTDGSKVTRLVVQGG